MQKFGKTLITDSGRRMLVQVDGAQGQITYTNATLFTQDIKDMSEEEQIALTALTGQQLITPVSVSQVTDTTVTVSASFNNSKVTEDLKFNSIGWYAKTSVDKQEQLMAVTPSLTEQTLVAGAEGASTSSLDINMIFGRSHDTTVVLNPNQEGVVNAGQMQEAIDDNAAQLKAEFAKAYATKDEVYPKQDVFSKKEIKALAPLNAPDGNNFYDTTINLDKYSTVGTTKFLNCKLQSSGQMAGFKQDTGKLYGWIFNIPKWNGATEFQQIVYICNYGDGTLIYLRSHVDNSGKTKEDFEKLTTDKDLSNIHTIANPIEVENKTNPDSLNEPGIYFTKNGFDFAKNDVPDGYRSDGKSYLAVLEGDNPDNGINYYQQFLFQATKFNFECWYRAGYKYGSGAYYTVSFVNLKDIFGKLKQICLNGGAAISPDDNGVANLNVVTKVDGIAPDNDGNVQTDHYTKAEIDQRVTDINSHIDTVEKREITHVCDDYDTGVEYSKNHKDVFVAVTGN